MNDRYAQGKRVFVGLSGGVDSSVSAALLKESGYDVTGVFIKVWQPDFLDCTWPEDRLDAMRVCAHLEIPFKTYDFEKEYKREVVDYMLADYKSGRTPNPDVMCNTYIKFDAFLRRALAEGASFIATGHYAQILTRSDVHELHAAVDANKDQSYFLWGLSQRALKHTLLPLSSLTKREVRSHARRFGLPTAEKRESQGLCFLGKLDMQDFLRHFVNETPGDVVNEMGSKVGTHSGAIFYTFGQRHGFQVHPQFGAAYVVAKNMQKNTITVSKNSSYAHIARDTEHTTLSNTNWIAGSPPKLPRKVLCRSRYRQALTPCIIQRAKMDTADVTFETEKPVTPPGQSLVFYDDVSGAVTKQLLGGGVIESLV